MNKKSGGVVEFLGLEEVRNCELDQTLFDYLYDQLIKIEEVNLNAKKDNKGDEFAWIKYIDEPDKRVFYRKEPGCNYQTLMTDCVMDASICQALACYENVEILGKLLPEFYDIKWLKKVTDTKGMMCGR